MVATIFVFRTRWPGLLWASFWWSSAFPLPATESRAGSAIARVRKETPREEEFRAPWLRALLTWRRNFFGLPPAAAEGWHVLSLPTIPQTCAPTPCLVPEPTAMVVGLVPFVSSWVASRPSPEN